MRNDLNFEPKLGLTARMRAHTQRDKIMLVVTVIMVDKTLDVSVPSYLDNQRFAYGSCCQCYHSPKFF